jgi:hypothetical protein
MDSGVAVKDTVGTGIGVTVTVTLLLAVPPGPVAMMVYVVVSAGITIKDPFNSTIPISGVISQESAYVDVHDNVTESVSS